MSEQMVLDFLEATGSDAALMDRAKASNDNPDCKTPVDRPKIPHNPHVCGLSKRMPAEILNNS